VEAFSFGKACISIADALGHSGFAEFSCDITKRRWLAMKRETLWLVVAVLGVGLAMPVWAQVAPSVTLDVLNAVTSGTNVAVVVQGDFVLVGFIVNPVVDAGPDSLIQLRRLDDGSLVTQQMRGDALSGTVSLATDSSNALGDLEAVYVLSTTGAVLAIAPETVRVVPSGEGGPSTVTVPSAQARTIQSAIDLVADGGTVRIEPGTYRENLVIVGKRVNLEGSGRLGRRRTMIAGDLPRTVVPYQQAQGLISFGPRGGGSVRNLILQGGDAGVVGLEDIRGAPAQVRVENAVIRLTGRGVLGSFSRLEIERVAITGTLWNGVSIVKAAAVALVDNQIIGGENIGVLVLNFEQSASAIDIGNQFIALNLKGGIVIYGSGQPVNIYNCEIVNNWVAGIVLWEAGQVVVNETIVQRVYLGKIEFSDGTVYDNLAWGLLAFQSAPVYVWSSQFHRCEQGGMIFDSSGGWIVNAISGHMNRFGLVVQGEPKPDYSAPSNIFWGTEQPVLTDGALPVPSAPPLPEP
jgi:hypothetical protein